MFEDEIWTIFMCMYVDVNIMNLFLNDEFYKNFFCSYSASIFWISAKYWIAFDVKYF